MRALLVAILLLVPASAHAATWTWAENPDDFPNPYRGWYCKQVPDGLKRNGACPDNKSQPGFNSDRFDLMSPNTSKNVAMANRTYRLGLRLIFQRLTVPPDRLPMTAAQLSNIKNNLTALRGTGVKAHIKMRPGGADSTDCKELKPNEVGTVAQRNICLDRIKQQIVDIGKALDGNASSVAVWEMGFFGDTGEFIKSEVFTTGATSSPCLAGDSAECDRSQEELHNHVSANFPAEIPISWRRPRLLRNLRDQSTPRPSAAWDKATLDRSTAHDGSPAARSTGYNACFVASSTDAGTFNRPTHAPRLWTEDMKFAIEDNKWGFHTGETCANVPSWNANDPWSDCVNTQPLPQRAEGANCTSNSQCDPFLCDTGDTGKCFVSKPYKGYSIIHGGAVTHFERLHYMNLENQGASGQIVIDKWRNQGCYDEITRRMGYRYVPKSMVSPDTWTRGSDVLVTTTIRNDGFARFWHAWTVYITLDDGEGNRADMVYAPVDRDSDDDIRFWPPYHEDSEDRVISRTVALPADLPAGTYNVAIWIPDPDFKTDSKYSMRLAAGIWDPANGYNVMGSVTVEDTGVPGPSGMD